MQWTLVRYRAKPDRADENQRLSAAVFDELQKKAPAGLRYAVFRLPDDTFVHLAAREDSVAPLSELAAFRAFSDGVRERCVEAPQAAQPTLVGNYSMLASDRPIAASRDKPRDIVSHEDWLAARKALLAAEKRLAEARADVIGQRRALPWTRVDKAYEFDTSAGRRTLSELFAGRSRLIVYHFMFAPEWQQGCPDCSRLADHFDGMHEHLPPRDATFAAISRAPLDRIETYRRHKGWRFTWVSSQASDFNYDYQVSYRPDQVGHEAIHGYEPCQIDRADLPGTSVFARNPAGEVFHVYSAYFNGGDMPLSLNYAALVE